jgi:D-galactarolactone cycloisomerase
MKITSVEAFHLAIPFEHGAPLPPQGSGGVRTTLDSVYVRIDTDQGFTGWGECFGFACSPVTRFALQDVVRPMLMGRACEDIPALMRDLHKRVQSAGRNGPLIFALSGVDIALWDIAGKAQNKPVHQMLGGDGHRTSVPAYASLMRLETPQNITKVCNDVVARGFGQIKLHERTIEAVSAARDALGPDVPLMLDTNCTWDLETAIDMAHRLEPYHLTWLEEPIFPPDDYKALAKLRASCAIPIAAGENLGNLLDVERILDAQAVDVVQPDPIKMGGITECWKALQMAEARGVQAEPHSPWHGPGLAAALHLIAAMKSHCVAEFYYADLKELPIGDAGVPRDGRLFVPQGPGLGVEVNEDVVSRYRVA